MPNWDAIKPSDVGVKDDSSASSGPNWDAIKEPPKGSSAPRASAPQTQSSAPMRLPVLRTEAENPLAFALRAGSAAGKHLVATGKFGVPDVAGEDRDRATIRQRIGANNLPTGQLAPSLMINPTQGLVDFGTDTALDPTNVIPLGRIAKGIGEGAKLGAKAIGGLVEHSPQIVKDASGVVGAAGNALSDAFHWGGSARRDLSAEQYRDAGLELNKHNSRSAEAARRLLVRQSAIFSGLTDSQKIEAARVMNGEVDAVNDHAVMKAAKEAKSLLDDAFTLESNASGRARAAVGSTKAGNANLVKPETQTPAQKAVADLFRYQSTPGEREFSAERGGTYYAIDQPNKRYGPGAEMGKNLGGQHLIEGVNQAKNPLDLRVLPKERRRVPYGQLTPEERKAVDQVTKMGGGIGNSFPAVGVAGRLRPGKPTAENWYDIFTEVHDPKNIGRYLKALGVPQVDVEKILAREGTWSALDRMSAELARKSGHDAIIHHSMVPGDPDEFFALHPDAHGPVEHSSDDFESMVPNDLPGATTQANLKRIVAQNLPQRELPPELREFQTPAEQGVLGANNYRQTYHPGFQAAQTEADDFTRPKSYNLLNPFAGHALEREDFKIGDVPDEKSADTAAQLQAALTRRLKASANQASAGQLRAALGVKPGLAPEALAKLFDVTPRASGEARNWQEKGQDLLRLPADAARSTLTAFGLKHGLVNVPTLAALSEGASPVGSMFGDAGKLMKMSPEEKWEFMRGAREAGVLGAESDRDNQTLGLLDKVPLAARSALGGAYGGYEGQKAQGQGASPLQRLEGGGAGALLGASGGAALPRIGRFSNELTWALDEAAKKAVFTSKVKKGMSPAEAAQQTLDDTVNYTHRTPVAEALQKWGLAPFATFATKIPGAVAGSVARNPHNAIMLDRLTQGLASNGTLDLPNEPAHNNGSPEQLAISNPLSETAELLADPMRYVRAKSSDPARIASSAIAELLSHGAKEAKYMTYGQPIFPHVGANGLKSGYALNAAAGDIPLGIGRSALDGLDIDEFSPQSAASQILGPILGAYIK